MKAFLVFTNSALCRTDPHTLFPVSSIRCRKRKSSVWQDSLCRSLEVYYQFLPVHLGDEYRGMCRNDRRIRITDREGYISSLSAVRDRVGSSVCPWFIEAPPGQRINLTLYDFGKQTDPGNSAAPPVPFCQRCDTKITNQWSIWVFVQMVFLPFLFCLAHYIFYKYRWN